MGSQTPIYGFPFPLGTDRVMDGDDAIRALAEKVESLSTTWQPITLQSGWIPYGAPYQAPRYRKTFDVVQVQGSIKGGLDGPGNTIFNLPAGFRPAAQLILLVTQNDKTFLQVEMTPAGNLVNSGWAAPGYVSITFSFAL